MNAPRADFAQSVAEAVDSIGDGVVIASQDGVIAWASAAAAAMFQYTTDELVGQPLATLMESVIGSQHNGFVRSHLDRNAGPPVHRRLNIARRADGSTFPIEIALAETARPDGHYFTAVMRDASAHAADEEQRELLIRELANSRQQFQHAATHDRLTELANREHLQKLLGELIEADQQARQATAVAFIDLDRFKTINDTFGHQAGDHVLQTTAVRMRDCMGAEAVLARVGGDEFVAAFSTASASETTRRIESLYRALTAPCLIEGGAVDVGASIGVATTHTDGRDLVTLLKAADRAMYDAKRDGGGVSYHSADMNDRAVRRQTIAAGLPQAIKRHECSLAFQPIASLPDDGVCGAQAILQWTAPRQPPVQAPELMRVAADLQLVETLDRWGLRETIRHLQRIDQYDVGPLHFVYRVAATTLDAPDLAAEVTGHLATAGVAPGRLLIEVTEADLDQGQSHPQVVRTIQALHAIGVRVAIGDFGAGQGSLTRVMATPVDVLHVAPAIATRAHIDSAARIVLEGAVTIGNRLGWSVVATGVETPEQYAMLTTVGCSAYVGPYLAGPLAFPRFAALARAQPAAAPPAAAPPAASQPAAAQPAEPRADAPYLASEHPAA